MSAVDTLFRIAAEIDATLARPEYHSRWEGADLTVKHCHIGRDGAFNATTASGHYVELRFSPEQLAYLRAALG